VAWDGGIEVEEGPRGKKRRQGSDREGYVAIK